MFVTMVILIIGFLFSSYLLFHYRTKTANLRPPLACIKNTVTEQAINLSTNLWNFTEEKDAKKPKKKKKKKGEDKPLPFSLNKLMSSSSDEQEIKPLLVISGVGYIGQENLGYVIIDGIQYLEGETKNEITIVKININKTVQIKYKGETKLLHIGENL